MTVVAGIWSSLAVLGIHAIFNAHQHLRMAVQIAGGCYLLYLGVRFWPHWHYWPGKLADPANATRGFPPRISTNFTNPKSVLFFSSVLATGLPEEPSAMLLGMAVVVVIINAFLWHVILALAFSHQRVQMAYGRSRKVIGRAAGVMLGAFGLRLFDHGD